MNRHHRLLLTLAFSLVDVPASWAAEARDPAQLFPAETLVYAELHDPSAFAPQFAALVKGTALQDGLAFIHGRRDKAKGLHDLNGKSEVGFLTLLAAPELSDEFRRIGGAAIGITGFTDRGEPIGAAVLLTGESHAAGLAARAFLTMSQVRKVGMASGIAIYQLRQPTLSNDPIGGQPRLENDKPPVAGSYEPTFAYLPGLFVVGTDLAAVGDAVVKFQGNSKGSLAALPSFGKAAADHRRPGFFFYANATAFCAKFDRAIRRSTGVVEPEAYGWFKLIVRPTAVQSIAGSIRFRDGGLAVAISGAFDPTVKSPIFDLISGGEAGIELLHRAPAPATVAIAIALPEKSRSAAVVGFMDAIAKANGEIGRLPSDAIVEMSTKNKLSVADDLIAKINALTLVIPSKQELPKGAIALPMLAFHAESSEVAAALEAFLPTLVGDLAGREPPQPASETIGGVKVFSLAGSGLPWNAAIHFARSGKVVAIGLDRNLVAAAATADALKSIVAGNALPVREGKTPPFVGLLAAGGLFRELTERRKPAGPIVPITPVGTTSEGRPGGEEIASSEKQKVEESKAWAALPIALDAMPAATIIAERVGNELRIEVWQPKVQGGGLGPVIEAAFGLLDARSNRTVDANGQIERGFRRFR